ncbi:6-phosphofructokinase [Butyrivibrio sp. XPD2002]|uniref:6-phosphofructokinase n=1 Tax=Butyrivibrio sp. XPD2002 TaxID=1280665 RepID=UPI0003FB66D7|nr:6-phosphofructokinase [Butyrivibrio sp. XPD2002]
MNNCIIAQSGGPTVAINASLAGVLLANEENRYFDTVYGSINGITGIFNSKLLNLSELQATIPDFAEKLKVTPAMYLGSCRYKLPKHQDEPEIYEKIFKFFAEHDINAFFYIGGNDSMDTVLKLSEYAAEIGSDVKIIGIPKTIDNDLCGTDHTPGFGSAAKYIASSILEIAHDTYIYPVKSVTIVEVMGRDAGWLTAASALARNEYSCAPHLIYLPERAFDENAFIEDVKRLLETNNSVVVAVSEGIRDKDGNYISASSTSTDNFGHNQLSGAGKALESLVAERIGVKVRSVEVNILQRCASHLASLTDLNESAEQGKRALLLAKEGKSGVMVTLKRTGDTPYCVETDYQDIHDTANLVKNVPDSWINAEGNDVTEEMLTYLRPLIAGEPVIRFKNGVPEYLDVRHLKANN